MSHPDLDATKGNDERQDGAGAPDSPVAGVSFQGISIVACGTVRAELRALADEGFLDADALFFTAPGLHEWPWELEKQLPKQLARAREHAPRVVVAYGERCFLDTADPTRDTDALLREQGPEFRRIRAKNCVDMLADEKQRRRIAEGQKVYWLTPGWLAHWKYIFKDWDAGLANETFPAHDKAIVVDALGYFDQLMAESPERVLEISDWMKLPIEAAAVSLDRLKRLLANEVHAPAAQ
ncbi:MAG: DUF1638 domain-containing protein [bacterium]